MIPPISTNQSMGILANNKTSNTGRSQGYDAFKRSGIGGLPQLKPIITPMQPAQPIQQSQPIVQPVQQPQSFTVPRVLNPIYSQPKQPNPSPVPDPNDPNSYGGWPTWSANNPTGTLDEFRRLIMLPSEDPNAIHGGTGLAYVKKTYPYIQPQQRYMAAGNLLDQRTVVNQ